MANKPVRTRFAPSPTGFLHVGGARTALFAWLWARHNEGQFVLRIEDTDVERSTDASTDQILESLQWLGITWDEGPYFQSQRLHIYREHIEKLRAIGAIYPAFETKEELEASRQKAMAEKRNPIYDRASLRISPDEAEARIQRGDLYAWRFRVPDEGYTEIPETLRGDNDVKFLNADIGDFLITRPGTIHEPGMPLYNFVCTVDDALMNITHVIRAVEHLPNTPKQVLLYKALGYEVPTFTHLPLIMKNNKKMSKRDGDADPRYPVSVSARRDLGYLKESTLNFLSLLGWSAPNGEEIFPLDYLIENFSLDRLVKANANFDEDKYLFQNGWYIRNLPVADITARVRPFLERAGLIAEGRDDQWYAEIIGLEIERCKLLSEFPGALSYFFAPPESYDSKGVKKLFAEASVVDLLEEVASGLAALEPFDPAKMEELIRALSEQRQVGLGKVAQPVRLALTGRTASPGLFDVIRLLGRDESVRRLQHTATLLRAGSLPLTP